MALEINYKCTNCGKDDPLPSPLGGNSMLCKCGGERRPEGSLFGNPVPFDRYYDSVLGREVSSYREQERLGKNFRSKDHPEGLHLVQENSKAQRERRHLKKHLEDRRQEMFGGRYKPGSGMKFDDKKQDFVPRSGNVRTRTYSFGK